MSFLSPLPQRLSTESRPRHRRLYRSLSMSSLSSETANLLTPLEHPHLRRRHRVLGKVPNVILAITNQSSISKQVLGLQNQMSTVAPALTWTLPRTYSTPNRSHVRPQTSSRYRQHSIYPMRFTASVVVVTWFTGLFLLLVDFVRRNMRLPDYSIPLTTGHESFKGLGLSNGSSPRQHEQHYAVNGRLSAGLPSADPLFVDTNACLALVHETRPSFDMKTYGKKPLSNDHLLSLVDLPFSQREVNGNANSGSYSVKKYTASHRDLLNGNTTRNPSSNFNDYSPASNYSPSQRVTSEVTSNYASSVTPQLRDLNTDIFGRYGRSSSTLPTSNRISASYYETDYGDRSGGRYGSRGSAPPPNPPQRSLSSSLITARTSTEALNRPPSPRHPALFHTPIRFKTDPLFERFDVVGPKGGTLTSSSYTAGYSTGPGIAYGTAKPLPPRDYSPLSPGSAGSGRKSPFVSPRARGYAPPPTDQPIRNPVRHGIEGEVDSLTIQMLNNMMTGRGAAGDHICVKCGDLVGNGRVGCTALDQTYHVDCFKCVVCGMKLGNQKFYALDGRPYCDNDYMSTLEKCATCYKPIMERILRASGKPYHPNCFTCTVCRRNLDGFVLFKLSIPFTVDSNNLTHCVDCYHEKFAPRCAICRKPIIPEEGKDESLRVVAMDKSFHLECYKCEDCGLKLSSQIEGQGCYPLDDHILCRNCNAARVRLLTRK